MEVKVKKLHPDAVIPKYAYNGDMGMDITAIGVEYNEEKDCFIYHTGLAFEVPNGYGMLLFPRSSNVRTDAYLANHVGVLDSCYRGELTFCFKNRDRGNYQMPYQVGERIGQAVIIPYPKVTFVEVDELTDTERGIRGYGSSGK